MTIPDAALLATTLAVAVDLSPTTLLGGVALLGLGLIQWLGVRQITTHEATQRDHTLTLAAISDRLTRLEERHRALAERTSRR